MTARREGSPPPLRGPPARPGAAVPASALAARISTLLILAAACTAYGPGDVTGYERRVGGRVHGLWDGAEGLVLRLEAEGIDASLSVSADGAFRFAEPLARGASYAVTVAASPALHACVVETGGSGTIAGADVTGVSVSCTGPVGTISLSRGWAGTFDPAQERQSFDGSIVVQDVALTISGGSLVDAHVAGTAVTLGEATAPIPLPLGATAIAVALTASGGLSKTYQLVFDRGGSVLEQVVYGKASNTGSHGFLGGAIALSGDTLVVGATGESSGATGVDGNQADESAPGAGAVYVFVRTGETWTQQAYLKASNTGAGDGFGNSVALSGDTLAVGAILEDGSAAGIDGDQADDGALDSGAVYVFVRTGTTWAQQAYLKASHPGADDLFGHRIALSGDTLVVGASGESSSATGVDGDEADDSAPFSGAAYVFVREGATWIQQAYLKASNTLAVGQFGSGIAISGDTLAVAAIGDSSAATGVDGDQDDVSAEFAGAVYVFVRDGKTWVQQAYVKPSNTEAFDLFGFSVALSGDTLAVGATGESSAATGTDGDPFDEGATSAGAVYVFVRHGATWNQQAYVKASNTGTGDNFGASVALSGDTLAVGANGEASSSMGVGGDQADDAAPFAGAVYLFVRMGTRWTQQAYVKASNTGSPDVFGSSLALSGGTLAVGAPLESSGATGVNPVDGQADDSVPRSGAVYVF